MVEPYFQAGNITLYCGDNREVLAALDVAVSAVCTDPPYGLSREPDMAEVLTHWLAGDDYTHGSNGFMGKSWDSFVPGPATWRLVAERMLPGAHLCAFAGTRTSDLMGMAIRLAGLERRDTCLYWGYGSGFPKSHNVSRVLRERGETCNCEGSALQYNHENVSPQGVPSLRQDVATGEPIPVNAEPDLRLSVRRDTGEHAAQGQAVTAQSEADGDLRHLRQGIPVVSEQSGAGTDSHMLEVVQRGATGEGADTPLPQGQSGVDGRESGQLPATHDRIEQPGMEGRGDVLPQARQLQADQVRSVPAGPSANGAEGRLCDGASPNHGRAGGVLPAEVRSSAPSRPRSPEQRSAQPRTLAVESSTQTSGAWPICERCGLPMVPEGLGSALKPSYEPIILARKPFPGTVASQVLATGTGALNIGASRVGTAGGTKAVDFNGSRGNGVYGNGQGSHRNDIASINAGRWPPNTLLDPDAAAMLDQMSGERKTNPVAAKGKKPKHYSHDTLYKGNIGANRQPHDFTEADTHNGASRFFPVLPVDDPDTLRFAYVAKAPRSERVQSSTGVSHPTQKPLSLMRWLLTLVTPPGGIVLDPFAGSGSTGVAAAQLGIPCILIEQSEEYAEIAARRIEHALAERAASVRQIELAAD